MTVLEKIEFLMRENGLNRSHRLFAVFPRLSREGITSGDTPNKKVRSRCRYRSSNRTAMKGE